MDKIKSHGSGFSLDTKLRSRDRVVINFSMLGLDLNTMVINMGTQKYSEQWLCEVCVRF